MTDSPAISRLPRPVVALWQRRQRLDVMVLAVFGLALAIRLAGLGRDSLWLDEAFSAQLAALPIPRLIQGTAGDLHPPLWYLVEWAFLRLFGASEFVIRLPAALAGAAAAAWLARLVGEMSDSASGWLAGGLLAVLPGQVWMGQEARMYALLTWLVLVAALALVRRQWNLLRLASLLALYTHNLATIYVAVLVGLAFLVDRRQALLTGLICGIGWLPWLGSIVGRMQVGDAGYWIPQVGVINGLGYWQLFTTWFMRTPTAFIPLALIADLALIVLAAVTGWKQRARLGTLTALAFVPPVVVVVLHLVWQPILLPKPLQPATAALVGLWAVSIRRMRPVARWAALVLLIGITGAAWVGYVQATTERRAPVAVYADLIRQEWQPGDVQAHAWTSTYFTFEHYLPQDQFPAMLLIDPEAGEGPVTPQTARALDMQHTTLADLAERGTGRIWYITTPDRLPRSETRVSPAYRTVSRIYSEQDGVVILLLELEE